MIGIALKKIFGTRNQRLLKHVQPIVDSINALETEIAACSDEDLRKKTDQFRARLSSGETLDDILPEAYAIVREAGKRVLNMRHFDVQMIGGIVLHQGKITEMVTGEGKTLVATLPVYLNALTGKGAHVVTVNDYLARRDRDWMGPLYEFLGLTVGVIQHDMKPDERQVAYGCDITYGTNNEFGFDYLRDNMVVESAQRVQRDYHFGIVDEVDSILIDEARTPLIISGPADESTDIYYRADQFCRNLKGRKITEKEMIEARNNNVNYEEGYDYLADEKRKTAWFTEQGEKRFEDHFNISPEDPKYIDFKHHGEQALKAWEHFKRDADYVVKEGQVIIVDEFTGRLMPGRRFSDGLHQALEAKEGVKIERENQTLATITFQNYFRMYDKLAGMTGTAATEAIEFDKIYNLEVVVIPTNKPLCRINHADVIYKTEYEKQYAVVKEIQQLHKQGRPVLVGTITIEKSEQLSSLLTKHGLQHAVLNAKYHEKEAEIISKAGQPSAITISTNMAGRGTDIVLGEGVAEKGGLHVLGTERHESRRIDNQLRGRSGRQGDPGSSKFFISLQDDLMRIFGSDRIATMMDRLGMEEGQNIQHPLVSKAIETAQRRVEGMNFEIRKHLLEYDDVMNRQREIIYSERKKLIVEADLSNYFFDVLEDYLETVIFNYLNPDIDRADQDEEGFFVLLNHKFKVSFDDLRQEKLDVELLFDAIIERIREAYQKRKESTGQEVFNYLQRSMFLHVIDTKWKDHLYQLDCLREGIGLRAYGQRNPLVEYKREAFALFDAMTETIKEEILEIIFKVEIQEKRNIKPVFSADNQQYIHEERPRSSTPPREEQPGGFPQQQGQSFKAPSQESSMRASQPKVGRNEPCPCGSGKKYKKCCGA
ncbi:preprotein translocase subunit SecA [Candidatus Omnitrophota bacterium]